MNSPTMSTTLDAWLDNNADHVDAWLDNNADHVDAWLDNNADVPAIRADNMTRSHTRPHWYKLDPSATSYVLCSCDTVREMPFLLQLHGSAYEEARENKIQEIRQKSLELGLDRRYEIFWLRRLLWLLWRTRVTPTKLSSHPFHLNKGGSQFDSLVFYFTSLSCYLGVHIMFLADCCSLYADKKVSYAEAHTSPRPRPQISNPERQPRSIAYVTQKTRYMVGQQFNHINLTYIWNKTFSWNATLSMVSPPRKALMVERLSSSRVLPVHRSLMST